MINLPKEFLANMKKLLNNDFEKFIAIYDKPYLKGLRVNTKKISTERLRDIMQNTLINQIPYADAFYVNADDKLGNTPYHHAGLFYLQEPSAMQPALCQTINKDAIVLDMCASPGGKSGQIAEQLSEQGLLVCNEIITNRAKVLKENMDRLGYKNVIVTSTTVQNLTRLGKIFDYIFLDAPCSGEGLFRREPKAVEQWNSGINQMNGERQLELLMLATKLLKPGGKIIYSTCTFSKVENEDVVYKFLSNNTNFEIAKINENLFPYSCSLAEISKNTKNSCSDKLDENEVQNFNCVTNDNDTVRLDASQRCQYSLNENLRRVMPHINEGEGQFYACLQNTDAKIIDNKNYQYLETLKASEKQIVNEFIDKYTNLKNLNIKSYEGNILFPPQKEINTKGIFVLKYGVNLGKIEKRRFIPNHNFFTSFGDEFKIKINLSESDVNKYLKGEQLEIDDEDISGYCAVCIDGYVLGGGKVQNGKINNLYPKYLRLSN
ncbi:MAG: RsmF rRNA methyltransferase first C-terminal domain-containing protein [Christensenellales bacterium]